MPLIRQRPHHKCCRVCSSNVDLPHRTEADCQRALATEMHKRHDPESRNTRHDSGSIRRGKL
jgi:hypothetical protein